MIDGLDHMTIVTADLAASRRFYAEVLGLVDGERPPFDVPGAWLYQGDRPIVHLVGRESGDAGGSTGPFDHLAFRASDLAGTVARAHGTRDLSRRPIGHVTQRVVAQVSIALRRAGLLVAKDLPDQIERVTTGHGGARIGMPQIVQANVVEVRSSPDLGPNLLEVHVVATSVTGEDVRVAFNPGQVIE